MGMMEKKMETTIVGLGVRVKGLGSRVWGLGLRSLGFRGRATLTTSGQQQDITPYYPERDPSVLWQLYTGWPLKPFEKH